MTVIKLIDACANIGIGTRVIITTKRGDYLHDGRYIDMPERVARKVVTQFYIMRDKAHIVVRNDAYQRRKYK